MLARGTVIVIVLTCLALPSTGRAQRVRSSYSGTSGQNLPFWVTHEAGLFKKYGLASELLLISGGLTNIQALLANEIQFVYLGGAAPIQAAVQGADIVIIATAYGLMPYGLVGGKEIRAPADLKGKRIAVSRVGGIEEVAIRAALDKLGMSAKDVTFVQTGPDALRIAALETGAAAGAAFAPPGLFAATARGLHLLADLGALNITYPVSVIAASRAYLSRDRATAKKYLMAFIEGVHLYKSRKGFALEVLQRYTKQKEPKILSDTYDYFVKNTPAVPLSDAAAVQNALPADRSQTRSAKDFYDNSLVQELVNEKFVERVAKEFK